MNFGEALQHLKNNERVCRSGWNGKGMWLLLVRSTQWMLYDLPALPKNNAPTNQLPWIGMKTATNEFVPWLASQTDMLAEDWKLATE